MAEQFQVMQNQQRGAAAVRHRHDHERSAASLLIALAVPLVFCGPIIILISLKSAARSGDFDEPRPPWEDERDSRRANDDDDAPRKLSNGSRRHGIQGIRRIRGLSIGHHDQIVDDRIVLPVTTAHCGQPAPGVPIWASSRRSQLNRKKSRNLAVVVKILHVALRKTSSADVQRETTDANVLVTPQ